MDGKGSVMLHLMQKPLITTKVRSSRETWDCWNLVQTVMQLAGVNCPHRRMKMDGEQQLPPPKAVEMKILGLQ
jgi:hypothetical protein